MFDDACALLASVLDGPARRDIVLAVSEAPSLGRALSRLREAMRANAFDLAGHRFGMERFVNAYDRLTRQEGFHVLHDWDQDRCLSILGSVRQAMNAAGRVLIVEMVIPAGDAPHPGKMLDMAMLVQLGGQERTSAEYGFLLSKAACREILCSDRHIGTHNRQLESCSGQALFLRCSTRIKKV